jgi:peptidoglycan/LPS O-acetylase OafA/YrhL
VVAIGAVLITRRSLQEQGKSATHSDRRADIQGLRAVAVLLVIADHAQIPGFAGGYVGVDVFFVISGYVITNLLVRETDKGIRQGMADFYTRRVRRIVPAATATLIATLVAAQVATRGRINPNLPGDVHWASLFGMNFRLIRTGSDYFIPGIQPSLITQFWSLAVEEQFYLVFPLIVFLVARTTPPERRLRVLSTVVVVGIVLSAGWSVHLSSAQQTAAYYSPSTRIWELGLGCLLATATADRRPPRPYHGRQAASIGVVLLIVAVEVLNGTSVYPGWLAWLPCGAAALLIWGGTSGSTTGFIGLLSLRPLVYLGDISYSLYLTHYAWLNLPGQVFPPHNGWGWRLVELAGTLVTAMCSYHLLENPIRRWRRLADDKVAVILLLGVCVAASWAAAAVVGHLALS